MSVGSGPHVADGATVAAHHLGVEHQGFGVGDQDLHDAPRRRSRRAGGGDGVLSDESTRLVDRNREPEPGFDHGVGVVDVVAVVAVALLHAQARQRLQSGVAQPTRLAGVEEPVVHVGGLLGGHVQLVTELAEVGDPDAQHAREPDVDLPCVAERERRVRHVARRHRLQQLARTRSLDVELCVPRRHVGDERVLLADVAPHPRLHVAVGGVGGDDPEVVIAELGHCEVGLEMAGVVEPLGVGDPAGRAVDGVGRQVVEQPAGVGALNAELGHERHVHHDHAGARRLVLVAPVVPPRRPSPRQRTGVGLVAGSGVPVGALPSAHVAEVGAGRGESMVDGRQLDPRAVCIERVG